MGNEMYILGKQHYWLEGKTKHNHSPLYSHNYKYSFGDTVQFTKQLVGDLDAHSVKAATSSKKPNLVKYIRYRPIMPNSATIFVGDTAWKRVNDLKKAGQENVYTLDENSGQITFGDGKNGNLPLQGDSTVLITASYEAARDGFDDHYKAIKAVDPSITVLSCLVHKEFIETIGKSPYDGIAVHPYAGFWNLPKKESVDNYHDYVMLNSDEEADSAYRSLEIMKKHVAPDRKDKVQIVFTEYGIALGSIAPQYQSSIDQALYTGRIISIAIEMGMPLTSKHSITSIIGSAPHFIITPTGYLFKMYSHLFGSTHIPSQIANNPVRKVVNGQELPKLHVISSKDKAGNVYLMVMNRDRADAVTADVEINKYLLSAEPATVWTLTGPEYTAYNTVENPYNVAIKESVANAKGNVLTHTFPAHSITAIKLSGKPK
jgi:alpha-N-arabinofuranosidase